MRSVDRSTAGERDEPAWDLPRPWVAVAWVAVIAALLSGVAYLGLKPDAWELFQKDFGCTALTNVDSLHSKPNCPDRGADRRADRRSNGS